MVQFIKSYLCFLVLVFVEKRIIIKSLKGLHNPILTIPGGNVIFHGLLIQDVFDLGDRVLVIDVRRLFACGNGSMPLGLLP